jgi:hypothetical protein
MLQDDKLVSVFEMLVTRLSDVEEQCRRLSQKVTQACTVIRTKTTEQWIEFFRRNRISCRYIDADDVPGHLLDRIFQIVNPTNADELLTIIVRNEPMAPTYANQCAFYHQVLRNQNIPLPLVIVDEPVFRVSSDWSSQRLPHTAAPILGTLVHASSAPPCDGHLNGNFLNDCNDCATDTTTILAPIQLLVPRSTSISRHEPIMIAWSDAVTGETRVTLQQKKLKTLRQSLQDIELSYLVAPSWHMPSWHASHA